MGSTAGAARCRARAHAVRAARAAQRSVGTHHVLDARLAPQVAGRGKAIPMQSAKTLRPYSSWPLLTPGLASPFSAAAARRAGHPEARLMRPIHAARTHTHREAVPLIAVWKHTLHVLFLLGFQMANSSADWHFWQAATRIPPALFVMPTGELLADEADHAPVSTDVPCCMHAARHARLI